MRARAVAVGKPFALALANSRPFALALALFAAMTNTELLPSGTSPQLIGILMLQGLLTALTYLVAFELQRRAGPVFYSLLGAVAAVFGLLAFIDELDAARGWQRRFCSTTAEGDHRNGAGIGRAGRTP